MSASSAVTGAVAVLAGPCGLSPQRLGAMLRHHRPVDALERLRSGAPLHPMVVRGLGADRLADLRARARNASVDAEAARCDELGVDCVLHGEPGYPGCLELDPAAPAALFVRGDVSLLERRRVGIVGTRHATTAGLATAHELGRELARHGVTIVSGLARGIDGAAHRGVRDAVGRAVAVVGCGPDVHYPRQHAALWEWIAEEGALVSEWPPGVPPEAWRFPQRNRIIAGMSEVVVVVESRERGGSLITAREALDRGVEVMVVPGSPRSRASSGTNRLLNEGAGPVTSVDDVLVALGLDTRRAGTARFDPRPRPDAVQARVLAACEAQPSNLDMIVAATGLSVTDAALAAARLERAGWLAEMGGWFEPGGSRLCR